MSTSEERTTKQDEVWNSAGEFPANNIVEELQDREIEIPLHFREYEFRQDRMGLYIRHIPCGDIRVTSLYGRMRTLAQALEEHAVSCEEKRGNKV